jgi:hypothetical protein
MPITESIPVRRGHRKPADGENNGQHEAGRPAGSGVGPVADHVLIEGEPFVRITHIDALQPFLISLASSGNHWVYVGSNSPLTAGRIDPDHAIFPYQTADKILRHADSSGALTIVLAETAEGAEVWEPWRNCVSGRHVIQRNLYKHAHNHTIIFEETNLDLGLRFSWKLETSEIYGLIRTSTLENISAEAMSVRYLDGWQQLLPPGISAEMFARYSYLAAAYMRHEREDALGIYILNSGITDRAEPCESLRAACAWSIGHANPTILLSTRQVEAFRKGAAVKSETEIRGDFGAYLAADTAELPPGGSARWITGADTGLDHAALLRLRAELLDPAGIEESVRQCVAAGALALKQRIAAADGLQQTADRTVTVHHFANVLFNCMRGGTPPDSYHFPASDFAAFIRSRNSLVFAQHAKWLDHLPARMNLSDLRAQARATGDTDLIRLAMEYIPLTFSRRHGDPSRPWNRFSIRLKDEQGRPIYGYEGNWRDIFQNWESLAQSYPECLQSMIAVFLNASTADGYNPYRITRAGIDWEVLDPDDPWSHIGYWGDHQIVYLLRLLESYERFYPGQLAAGLRERLYAYAMVPYIIRGFDELLVDPRNSIQFNRHVHHQLRSRADMIGNDGKMLANGAGDVVLVSLAEKLLVPLLVKLSNLVPGGGIWLNTQRPEWNDGNNALAGFGLSMVTVCYMRRYLTFLRSLFAGCSLAEVELSSSVTQLLREITEALRDDRCEDDKDRFRILAALGRAGEKHRHAVYTGKLGGQGPVPLGEVMAFLDLALKTVDASITANRREDGTYHSYNLLHARGKVASVRRLQLMCEGQVAALSSGLLSPDEVLTLLHGLRHSELYRPDQHSYLLQPDREVAPFLTRNTLPEGALEKARLLAVLIAAGDRTLVTVDDGGNIHFQSDLTNSRDLVERLDTLAADPELTQHVARDRHAVLELWETVFHHSAFTGRSGSMFAFEGLGSIYWHMVAKLLLAVQECHTRALAEGAPGETVGAIRDAYYDVRSGLGFTKRPAVYGAFPTDPYSHSPRHRGAQQPGMTGQVKEEILTRLGELGVTVAGGCISFEPTLLRVKEFIGEPHLFTYMDLDGTEQKWALPGVSLAFTYCQVPVCYAGGLSAGITFTRVTGETEILSGSRLPEAESRAIFARTGEISRILVEIPINLLIQ